MRRYIFTLVVLGWVAAMGCKKQAVDRPDREEPDKEEIEEVEGERSNAKVVAMAGGFSTSLFLLDNGEVWGSGINTRGQLGRAPWTSSLERAGLVIDGVKAIASGYYYSVVLKVDGTLWVLGTDFPYRGDSGTGKAPIQIMEGVDQVWAPNDGASSSNTSIFALKGHTLWAIGDNRQGKLGIGNMDTQYSFVKVAENVKMVSPAGDHTMIVKTDHTLWAAGATSYGQLGNGMDILDGSPPTLTPVKIMDNVKKAATGSSSSLMLTNDGDLWATGTNFYGTLADASIVSTKVPVKVMTGVKEPLLPISSTRLVLSGMS